MRQLTQAIQDKVLVDSVLRVAGLRFSFLDSEHGRHEEM